MTLEDGGARLLFTFGESGSGWILLYDIELFEGKNSARSFAIVFER